MDEFSKKGEEKIKKSYLYFTACIAFDEIF